MSNKCNGKVCIDGKICNPLTGRCIKQRIAKPKSCADIECPNNKECNPKTLRCIKIKLLKQKNDNKRNKLLIMQSTMNDKLYFYSKSADKAPGKGANEFVEDISLYTELSNIKDWRRVLSNFHMCPFKYNGHTYNTIEHVFQGNKIALEDKEKALLFTLESNHEIGQGDGEIARKHRKLIKLNAQSLQTWAKMRDKIMHDAAVAKYKACPEARAILKATNGAQLWHVVPRSKPIRFEHLERIRESL